MKKIAFVIGCIIFLGLYIQMTYADETMKHCLRSAERGGSLDSLFEGSNEVFSSAGTCDHCHGRDPQALASVDGEGGDINLVDDWSSTIMANSAIDPYWRAKVSEEIFLHPQHQSKIENECTKCHAPLGNYAHSMTTMGNYSMEQMLADPVALDGVSCLACHRQMPQPEVAQHSGHLVFDPNQIAYGPYSDVLITPMALYSGYIPELGNHISDSKLCAGCHSLVTETIDYEGNITDNKFVEQATWHEWLNSSYPAQNITCQKCHLTSAEEQGVILAAGYDTPPRSPYDLHTLAGGNTLMLKMLRDNRTALQIFASEQQFNETIAATLNELQNKSLEIEIINNQRTEDTLYLDLKLSNKTGHKLPSGYPARKMSVHLTVENEENTTIFKSGGFDETYYIIGENTPFEPHYNVIDNEQKVQIYEMVMGDINLERTNVLNKGYTHLKDNRLVPIGFSSSIVGADSTEIVLGSTDVDFNNDPIEGSGTDIIHYKIPLNNYAGGAEVTVEVYYQSIPPTFTEDIFLIDTPEINAFSDMMESADKSPVLMKALLIPVDEYVGIDIFDDKNSPTAFVDLNNRISIQNAQNYNVSLYTSEGKLITKDLMGQQTMYFVEPLSAGTYLIVFRDKYNHRFVKKILVS